ncbi:MAG: ABC transporter ATP-binding protein [Alphaproteobacteria bacterium]
MTERNDIAVETIGLTKNYGSVTALRSIDLTIGASQYFVLLGPSGGGKTTLLRLIGGFLKPTAGRILLHGRDVSDLPPNERPTSMVFQSYALFPHMNVARNVGYGLKLRRLAKAEIQDKVSSMLRLVGLVGFDARMPHELSGGQQQRVQLARSLVLDSDILLLDEPLAALDAKLRKDMCLELKHIQEQVGITFLHVTHNQEEAMTIADRIAIIADGDLIEEATPEEIYRNPQARFTAEFIGERNILQGRVVETAGGETGVNLGHATVRAPNGGTALEPGAEVSLSIPSEYLSIGTGAESGASGDIADDMEYLSGVFVERFFQGLTTNDVVRLADGSNVLVRSLAAHAGRDLVPGESVTVVWKRRDARLHST